MLVLARRTLRSEDFTEECQRERKKGGDEEEEEGSVHE
jgi:hypothetical protein